jgi:hypothetical protein
MSTQNIVDELNDPIVCKEACGRALMAMERAADEIEWLREEVVRLQEILIERNNESGTRAGVLTVREYSFNSAPLAGAFCWDFVL